MTSARSIRGGADSALRKTWRVKPFSLVLTAAVAAATVTFSAASGARTPAVAATAPPTPPALGTPATPQPDASIAPGAVPSAAATVGPSPSPPPKNARKGVEGVWEVQIQHPNATDYTHLALTQQGDAVSGTYVDGRGKKYPLAGTVDGQAVRLIVSMPNGTTILLEGRLDGTTDMVGELTTSDGTVPFTAAYRAKTNWIENVNPSPGGMPSGGTYTPP
jgi:hypothetical protein